MKTSPTESEVLISSDIPQRSLVWSPWMTAFWALVTFFIFGLAQEITTRLVVSFRGLSTSYDEIVAANVNIVQSETQSAWDQMMETTAERMELISAFLGSNDLIWPAALGSAIFGSLVLFIIIRLKKGLSFRDYLHLKNVSAQVWGIWLIIAILFLGLTEWLAAGNESLQTPFMKDVINGTKSMPMLILTVGILAPIFEELLFRGFLFKGLERGLLGGHGTVWLSSIIFALIHLQYSIPIMLLIIPMALLLGYSRMYSGSLLVPIVLHVLNNTIAIGFTAYELHQGAAF